MQKTGDGKKKVSSDCDRLETKGGLQTKQWGSARNVNFPIYQRTQNENTRQAKVRGQVEDPAKFLAILVRLGQYFRYIMTLFLGCPAKAK